MSDQINQQLGASNHKGKAITSLILGIISVIPNFIVLISFYSLNWQTRFLESRVLGFILGLSYMGIGFLIVPLISITGIILGLLGLKSTKKNFAIAGIILSIIDLGTAIYAFLIALRIGTA